MVTGADKIRASGRHDRRAQLMRSSSDILLVHPGKQHAYEVAAALRERGRLLQFVTGIYDTPDSSFVRLAHASAAIVGRDTVERELSKRRHHAVDANHVTSWPLAELASRTIGRARVVQALSGQRSGYAFVNWATDRSVARALRRGRWRPKAVYSFLGAARHTFAACRELGIRTILDVPIILNAGETLSYERRVLGLKAIRPAITDSHLREEISVADHVVAPSRAVAQSLRAAHYTGGISEVPFGVDLETFRPSPHVGRADPFRVIYAGRLELRKGLHYLIRAWHEAAIPGELVLAGPAGEAEYLRLLRREYGATVREIGNLTRPELATALADSHVFVMPSLAEGSALVSYEALAAGLPAIVTHETGSVVRPGVDGFVVAARDADAIAARLRELHGNATLRRQMALMARARAEEFSWPAYRRRLLASIDAAADASSVQSAIA